MRMLRAKDHRREPGSALIARNPIGSRDKRLWSSRSMSAAFAVGRGSSSRSMRRPASWSSPHVRSSGASQYRTASPCSILSAPHPHAGILPELRPHPCPHRTGGAGATHLQALRRRERDLRLPWLRQRRRPLCRRRLRAVRAPRPRPGLAQLAGRPAPAAAATDHRRADDHGNPRSVLNWLRASASARVLATHVARPRRDHPRAVGRNTVANDGGGAVAGIGVLVVKQRLEAGLRSWLSTNIHCCTPLPLQSHMSIPAFGDRRSRSGRC